MTHGRASKHGTPVCVELFCVTLADGDSLRYLRRLGALPGRIAPDFLVAQWLRAGAAAPAFFDGEPAIVHSTSWRYETDGTVVLTYLAYGMAAAPALPAPRPDAHRLRWTELPPLGPTDPRAPRPRVFAEREVLAHALRHLALLVRREPTCADLRVRLDPASLALLDALAPEVAGQIAS